ncbi:unnamed protein product [Peniophora sp. CBMAI 1063]|nr:unnamed protein product [Peniophora sp. CBMAI 1063]
MGRKERTKLLRTSALNLRILSPDTLHDESGVHLALEQLSALLELAPVKVRAEAVLTQAIGKAGALPYLISVATEQDLNTLAQTALSLFPITQETWSETCTGWRILTSLLESAMFLPVETLDEHQRTLREMHQHVETTPSALLALASAQADLDLPLYDPPASAPADLDSGFSWNVKQTQRERKQAARRRPVADPSLDTDGLSGVSALSVLGYALPTSQHQAEEFVGRILTSCQAILKRLLLFFRRPVLQEAIRSMYIPITSDPQDAIELEESLADLMLDDDSLTDIDTESDTLVDDHSSTTDSEYLDGNRSSSHFYDEGFGPWRLVLSQRARGDLRESERGDAHMYSIWVKKMRELSHGHFSDDNQKRFIDRGFITPVFEAKMTRDTRLIYQIDLEPDPPSSLIRQVIYIYSFSNHRQVDKRLWNAIGHKMLLERRKGKGSSKWDHLSCKGRVYGKRCSYRALGMGYGETVIPPGEWRIDDEEGVAPVKSPISPQTAKRPKHLTIDLAAAQAQLDQSSPRKSGVARTPGATPAKSAPLLRAYTFA